MLTGLEWVVCNDLLSPVSQFVTLKPRARPPVSCPKCRMPVTLKLGNVRRHHAAHAPGASCAATHPETALHINMKCHIASVLREAIGTDRPVLVRRRCLVGNAPYDSSTDSDWREVSADACHEHEDAEWVSAWDEVRLEFEIRHVDGRRVPDIALLRDGAVIGAIEVRVTHAVDRDKAASLATFDVPWIELLGDESYYHENTAWALAKPLEPVASSEGVRWRCENHRAAHEQARATVAELAARVSEREAFAKRGGIAVESARLVDAYYPDGLCRRHMYTIVSVTNDGVVRRLALERDGEVVQVHLLAPGEGGVEFRARVSPLIQADYLADVDALRRGRGARIDSPMRWASGDAALEVDPASRRFPRRFVYSVSRRSWGWARGLEVKQWPVDSDSSKALAEIEAAMRGTARSVQRGLMPAERVRRRE